MFFFFFSSRRRHTRCGRDWSSDVCSSDLDEVTGVGFLIGRAGVEREGGDVRGFIDAGDGYANVGPGEVGNHLDVAAPGPFRADVAAAVVKLERLVLGAEHEGLGKEVRPGADGDGDGTGAPGAALGTGGVAGRGQGADGSVGGD